MTQQIDDRDALSLPARPRLAADVRVHPPVEEGSPWIIERDGRRYFRVGPDLARLAQSLTGDHDQRELLVVLGRPWSEDVLEGALRQLHGLKLLSDGDAPPPRRRRVSVVPPMTIQFTVLDPSRILRRLAPLTDLLGRRPALLGCLAIAVGGLVALALQAPTVDELISSPVPLMVFAVVFLGNFLATVVHEMAHGAVLTHFGGTPRRMGFMLFYLVPAFFCDVSDGWRLPRGAQRVRVALAGIAAQFVLAGVSGLVSLALPDSTLRSSMVLLSAVIYVAGSVNVIPFVKFDGYLALMSHLDISDLRSHAMADARAFLVRALFGVRGERALPGRRWVVPYGLGCLLFPLFLVGFVGLRLWSEIFARMGYVGAMINLSLVLLIVCGIGKELVRLHRAALDGGGRTTRLLGVDLVLAAITLAVLTQVQVARTVPAGYTVDGDTARLYVTTSSDADRIRPGQPVELRDNGILRRPQTGAATVGDVPSEHAKISMTTFTPLDLDLDLTTGVVSFRLDVADRPAHDSGVARVEVGERSVGGWLYDSYVAPVL